MKIADLPNQWESGKSGSDDRKHEYEMTLTDLYPDYSEEELLNDLLSAALSDLPDPGARG